MALTSRLLKAGPRDRSILAIDFGVGRSAATFADLAGMLPDEYSLEELSPGPPGTDLDKDTDPRIWTDALLRYVDDDRIDPTAIFGYCASTSLACAVADALVDSGLGNPRLLLFDPTIVQASLLCDYFTLAIRGHGKHMSADEAAHVLELATRIAAHSNGHPTHAANLVSTLCDLGREYRRRIYTLLDRLQLEAPFGEQMCDHFMTFLGFLTMAGRVDPNVILSSLRCGRAKIITSHDYEPLDLGETKASTHTSTFAVGSTDLLREPDVAAACARLLTDMPAGSTHGRRTS